MVKSEFINGKSTLPKFILAGAFFLIMLTAFMPFVTIASGDLVQNVNLWNLQEVLDKTELTELIPWIGGAAAGARKIITFFLIAGILSIVFPLAEAVLSMVLRMKACLLSAALGVLVNAVLKVLMISRLTRINSVIGGVLSQLGQEQLLEVRPNAGSLAVWILLHAVVAGVIAWVLICGRREETKLGVFKTESGQFIDEPLRKGREVVMERTFYGAILGRSGRLAGKGYPMLRGETVRIGTAEDSDVVIEGSAAGGICQISYDEGLQEYHVLPAERNAVFLKSGQPLGPNRTYCLPRGTEIMIVTTENRFGLA